MAMGILPDYWGVKAFGVKMGVILEGDNIAEEVYKSVEKCSLLPAEPLEE